MAAFYQFVTERGAVTAESYQRADNDFLVFSLSFYAWDTVEAQCLSLQDKRGANVNLLLWALWLDSFEYRHDVELWKRAHKAIKQSSTRAKYWRWCRRQCPKWRPLKSLRAAIKARELKSEIVVIETLFALGLPSIKGPAGNLSYYLTALNAADCGRLLQDSLRAWQLAAH